jgi:disulfide bond formation protein DsbB
MQAVSARFDKAGLIAGLVLLASVFSLATAFLGEHVFGLEPCILCLYERVPYVVAAVLVGAALVLAPPSRWRGMLLAMAAAVFALGAAVAFYHVGVEEHWWGSIAACGGELATGLDGEDLRSLSPSDLKPCDRVDWRLFGLSLAGYNALFSLILAGICAAGVRASTRRA